MLRAAHDHIAYVRQEEAADVLFCTVFAQRIHQRRVYAGSKQRIVRCQLVLDFKEICAVKLDVLFDVKEAFDRLAADVAKTGKIVAAAVDDHGMIAIGYAVIEICSKIAPGQIPNRLYDKHRDKRPRAVNFEPGNGDGDIDDDHAEGIRQGL